MFAKLLLTACLLVNLLSVNCLYYNDTPYLEYLKQDDVYFQSYYDPWHNESIRFLNSLSVSNELRPQCRASLRAWITGIVEKQPWALALLESTGKTIQGKLIGRNVNFGSYEYCTKFRQDKAPVDFDFDGKYCMVSVLTRESEQVLSSPTFQKSYSELSDRSKYQFKFNVGNAHGVCMPSTCDINEVASVVNKMFAPYGFRVLPPTRCSTASEPEPLTRLQIFSFTIIGIFVFLCLLSPFVPNNDFLACFSITENLKIIYNFENLESQVAVTATSDKRSESAFLHGIKGMLALTGICTHAFIYSGQFFAQGYGSIKEQEVPVYMTSFIQRYLPFAQNLYFLGGFLSMYAWYDFIKRKPNDFNWIAYFLPRWSRMAIVTLPIPLIRFVLPHFGNGPVYSMVTNHLYENCRENGHKLFTMTAHQGDHMVDMCNSGAWYLSADTQIAMFNYFLTYYLITKPKLGLILAAVQFVFFTALSILYNQFYQMPVFVNTMNLQIYDSTWTDIKYYHFATIYGFNIFTVGLLTAWLVKINYKPKILDYKAFRIGMYSLIFALIYFVYAHPTSIEQNGMQMGELTRLFYPIIDKLSFTFFWAWMVFTCRHGYSRFFLWIYSLRFWAPISRLTFSIGMLQFLVIEYLYASIRAPQSFDLLSMAMLLLVCVVSTFVSANVVFVVFEGPLMGLMKHYSDYRRRVGLIEPYESDGELSKKVH